MPNKSKTFLAFAIGAAIGVAITALFTTEKGKEIIAKSKSGTDDMLEKLKTKISDLQNDLNKTPNNNSQA